MISCNHSFIISPVCIFYLLIKSLLILRASISPSQFFHDKVYTRFCCDLNYKLITACMIKLIKHWWPSWLWYLFSVILQAIHGTVLVLQSLKRHQARQTGLAKTAHSSSAKLINTTYHDKFLAFHFEQS